MILVTGGSGTLGTLVVERLVARGRHVRVLTRVAERAAHLRGDLVDLFEGDVADSSAVRDAVKGARIVVSAIQGFAGTDPRGPSVVDHEGNGTLVRAAVAAGVEHFILVSVNGASPGHQMELGRMKFRAEEELMTSGLAWTIVRPTPFMETWCVNFDMAIAKAGAAVVLGRGQNPINFVSAQDVACLVELATRSPELRGQILDIGGPADLTINDFAAAFLAASGSNRPIRHVPRPVVRMMSLLLGVIRPSVASLLDAGLLMDAVDMRRSGNDARERFPEISVTSLGNLVAERAKRQSRQLA